MASEKVIFYEHSRDPQNIHIHGLIFGFSRDKTTLKNWCKEALGVAPARTQWEFPQQQKDGTALDEGYIAYMSKGIYDPKYVKGWSAEEIALHKEKGYDGKGANDEKPSKNLQYWRSFREWVGTDCEDQMFNAMTNSGKFERVRKWSYMFMMNNVDMPMPHDIARHKACVMKLSWELEIPIPPDSKYLI